MQPTTSILPLAAICVQCLMLPSYIVLIATFAYIILSIVLLLLPAAMKAACDPVPSRIVASGWVPRNIRLTVCNMILLYQILYLVLFVHISTRYNPVCTHVSSSRSISKTGQITCKTEQKICWPAGSSMEYAAELLTIDRFSRFPLTPDFPQCGETHTCIWASIYPEAKATFRSLPPRSHFITSVEVPVGTTHCNTPFYALYNVSYPTRTVAVRMTPSISEKGARFTGSDGLCEKRNLELTEDMEAVAIPFTNNPHSQTIKTSVHLPEEPWYLKNVLHRLYSGTHYGEFDNVSIYMVAIILPLFFSYYTCITEFHQVIQHSATCFFIYIQLPTLGVMWTLGGIAGCVGISLWSMLSIYRNPYGSMPLSPIFFVTSIALLSQTVYMLGVVFSLPLYDNMALGWQSTREKMNVGNFGLNDLFWRNRMEDNSIFLFFPGLLCCFYALFNLAWLCSTRHEIDS